MKSTDEIIELVFEGLAEDAALRLSSQLLNRRILARSSNDRTLEEELPTLEISKRVLIKRPHVRLLCYGDSIYDLEINFLVRDVEQTEPDSLTADLQSFAMKLSKPIGPVEFFAGLDPASDKDTRIFTGEKLGPLKLALG
jgi:hypothetical protein